VVIKPDSAPGGGQGSEPPISQCDWYKEIFSILSLVRLDPENLTLLRSGERLLAPHRGLGWVGK